MKMNDHALALPDMIDAVRSALATARTAAEVLAAREQAALTYDAAKRAARLAKVKNAHDEVVRSMHNVQADALEIESVAQCRLADEYDAAQERGEVKSVGNPSIVPGGNNRASTADIGLTRKQVHEARKVRDAEKNNPGIVRKALDARLAEGKEPTRADVNRVLGKARRSSAHTPRKPKAVAERQKKIVAFADAGMTTAEISQEVGVVTRVVNRVLEVERVRREPKAEIDPGILSLTAREKLEIAIRQHKRKLDQEFEYRVLAEVKRRIDELVLPQYNKEIAESREIMKTRKGVMPRAQFKKILSCLHPDWVGDEKQKRRYEEAFRIFNGLALVLVSEAEMPTISEPFPRTYEEMMRRKADVRRRRHSSGLSARA